jgi:hypothetical protein
MSITVIQAHLEIDLTANPPGSQLLPTSKIVVPNQPGQVLIMWTISPAEFSLTNGIVITSGPAPAVGRAPSGDATMWTMSVINNGADTAGNLQYVANWVYNGQNFNDDPVIDNQPPT